MSNPGPETPERGLRAMNSRDRVTVAVIAAVIGFVALVSATDGGSDDAASGTPATTSGISASCLDAMAAAAAEVDSTAADPLIRRTLSVCSDAVEWIAALQQHPAAMGLNARAAVNDLDVVAACGDDRSSPVCEDAARRGVLD
jgi:hypothetical protein